MVVSFSLGAPCEWLKELVKLFGSNAWTIVGNGQKYIFSLLLGSYVYSRVRWAKLDGVSNSRLNELLEFLGLDI